jgi:hypothetical protein
MGGSHSTILAQESNIVLRNNLCATPRFCQYLLTIFETESTTSTDHEKQGLTGEIGINGTWVSCLLTTWLWETYPAPHHRVHR